MVFLNTQEYSGGSELRPYCWYVAAPPARSHCFQTSNKKVRRVFVARELKIRKFPRIRIPQIQLLLAIHFVSA